MQVLPVADISDRRHLVPKHPLGTKHLVLSNLSDQPSQDKTGLSALDLKRQLGVSYPTVWLIQQKLIMRHWTPEERLKQSKLIKNWQPWKKSTGARTPKGKARSSQNAYKHGLSKLQKEMGQLLKQQKQFVEVIS